jgi:hypothetical protein
VFNDKSDKNFRHHYGEYRKQKNSIHEESQKIYDNEKLKFKKNLGQNKDNVG